MSVITAFSGSMPSKGQAPTVFDANVTAFLAYIAGLAPEINTAIAEILVGANVTVWANGVYNPPTIVAGSDGNRYACIATTTAGDNPVGSVTGKWYRLTMDTTAIFPTISAAVPKHGDIRGNDATVSGNVITFTPGSCKDSTDTVSLYSGVAQTLTIPSAANTRYYIFKVRLIADGSCEHRYYTTLAGPASDVQIDAYRLIDYWETNGSNACKAGMTVDGYKWFTKFSENTINSQTAPPSGITTAIDISTLVPISMVSGILFGAQSASASGSVFLSSLSGSAQAQIAAQTTDLSAGQIYEWGLSYGNPFIPLSGNNIYWGKSNGTHAGTAQLAIHAIRLRR